MTEPAAGRKRRPRRRANRNRTARDARARLREVPEVVAILGDGYTCEMVEDWWGLDWLAEALSWGVDPAPLRIRWVHHPADLGGQSGAGLFVTVVPGQWLNGHTWDAWDTHLEMLRAQGAVFYAAESERAVPAWVEALRDRVALPGVA